jgi:hypothetical protein
MRASYIDVLTTYGTTAMSVVRNFVNDPYWLIDFFIFFCCFNATFSNISAILWLPVLVVDEAGVSGENHRHGQATGKLYHLRLRVECTFFVIYKAGLESTSYW